MVLCIREVLKIRWWRSKNSSAMWNKFAGNREIAALRYNYVLMLYMYSILYHIYIYIYCRMLKHPNIVSFIGYASSESELVLVMEFIDGTNLHHLIFGSQRIITRVRELLIPTIT